MLEPPKPAKYQSVCRVCREIIPAGSSITHNGDRKPVHAGCSDWGGDVRRAAEPVRQPAGHAGDDSITFRIPESLKAEAAAAAQAAGVSLGEWLRRAAIHELER